MFRAHVNGYYAMIAWRDSRGEFVRSFWRELPDVTANEKSALSAIRSLYYDSMRNPDLKGTTVLDTSKDKQLSPDVLDGLLNLKTDLDILPRRLCRPQYGDTFVYVKRGRHAWKYRCDVFLLSKAFPYDAKRFERFSQAVDPFSPSWSDWAAL